MEKKEISTENINTAKTQIRREYLKIRNRLSKEDRQKDSRKNAAGVQMFLFKVEREGNER